MRGFRQWVSMHKEMVGILGFILAAAVIGGAAYGISYFLSGGSETDKVGTQELTTTLEASSGAASSEDVSGSQPSSQAQSTETQNGQTNPSSESPSAEIPSAGATDPAAPSVGDTINEHGVYFQIVEEQVTAKIETNLRRIPSTANDEDVVATIYNGDWIRRTGIGHNGWSRVEYEGQVLYAVTSYLSVDGSSASEPTYQDAGDTVTAKEEVYLRTTPDSASDSNVAATLLHGETVTRIGIGSNGWSKLNYNGTEVYAVTSLLEVVQ